MTAVDCPCGGQWTHGAASTSSASSPRTAEVVVAHCTHGLGWLDGFVGEVRKVSGGLPVNVTVYSKCGKAPEGLPSAEVTR